MVTKTNKTVTGANNSFGELIPNKSINFCAYKCSYIIFLNKLSKNGYSKYVICFGKLL